MDIDAIYKPKPESDKPIAGPQWMDRPSGPGVWLCVGAGQLKGHVGVMPLSALDLDRGAPFKTSRVYGPIPEDPGREA